MEGDNMYSACLTGIMKEFGEGHGVIYVDKPEDVLEKAIELIENGTVKEEGLKARRFVEKYSWDDIVEDFEGLLDGAIAVTFKVEDHIFLNEVKEILKPEEQVGLLLL
jgi:hypothetical protein